MAFFGITNRTRPRALLGGDDRLSRVMKGPIRLMLDSGAFSAWKRGEELELREYIAYIKDCGALFSSYVCLDTIPGARGRMSKSLADVEQAAASSYRNQQIMRDAGLEPIPVFHQGERFEWLEKMLASGEPYIGLSPYLYSRMGDITRWLDACFSMLVDARGRPIVKTHGFGATAQEIVCRYPFFTVDSTTWGMVPAYGQVNVPRACGEGNFDFSRPALRLTVTDAPMMGKGIKHVDKLTQLELDHLHKFLEACGVTVTDIRTSLDCRRTVCVKYFAKLAEVGARRFAHHSSAFARPISRGARVKPWQGMVFSTEPRHRPWNDVLNRCGVRHRLLSYYQLRTMSRADVEQYLQRGCAGSGGFEREAVRQDWSSQHYCAFRRNRLAARGEVE